MKLYADDTIIYRQLLKPLNFLFTPSFCIYYILIKLRIIQTHWWKLLQIRKPAIINVEQLG